MIQQLLLWLADTPSALRTAHWALKLARTHSARVYALYILPHTSRGKRGRKTHPDEEEEKAWEMLYEVEDLAFDQNVPISLLLESGEPIERLCEICAGYQPDLVVVSADCPLPPAEIIRQSPIPVVFVKAKNKEE